MEYGAIDLHKKESQIRIVTKSGQVIDHRVATTREQLTHLFWGRPRMRVLVEASTESEWVARCLEGLGHEVIVADPNFAPMYATRSRRRLRAVARVRDCRKCRERWARDKGL